MAGFYETVHQAAYDEAEAAMHAEAEMYRQQREEHDGEQALAFAVSTFGVGGVLRRLADMVTRKPTPDTEEPF